MWRRCNTLSRRPGDRRPTSVPRSPPPGFVPVTFDFGISALGKTDNHPEDRYHWGGDGGERGRWPPGRVRFNNHPWCAGPSTRTTTPPSAPSSSPSHKAHPTRRVTCLRINTARGWGAGMTGGGPRAYGTDYPRRASLSPHYSDVTFTSVRTAFRYCASDKAANRPSDLYCWGTGIGER